MASTITFTTKQVIRYFFTPVLDDQDEPTAYFPCQCSTVRKQDPNTGYTNHMSHVRLKHPGYQATMVANGVGCETLVSFMDTKSQAIYGWIDWTVACNLPFTFPENATKFGLVYDGWTFHSEHYIAVFAAFEHDGRTETVLLAMAPLVDGEVEDHTAESHVALLSPILEVFERQTSDLLFITGDNCSTNGRVATILGIPLVGCASHRLNLAVKTYLTSYEPVLRKKTALRPVLRNVTRWSSTFSMILRYFRLKEAICTEDDNIAALMPSRREENQLQVLLEELKDFESASLKLQSDNGISLLDVRDLFDALIEKYPTVAGYLSADAAIVHDKEFEAACVSVLMGNSDELRTEQRVVLRPFEYRKGHTQVEVTVTKMGFAEKALKKRKKERQDRVEYPMLPFIPPTSNCVERFFSQAKHLLSAHRTRMLPINLEMLLFFKINRQFWSARTVSDIVNNRTL